MGSLSLPKIPVIEFSDDNLRPETDSWLRTCKNVRLALEEYGCFSATYNKFSLDLHRSILHELEGLFDLPADVKIKNTSQKPYHGHVGGHPAFLEGMGIGNATSFEEIRSFADLMWPSGNDGFCDAALSYAKEVSELERVVKRMVFESYGLQKYYDSHVESSTYLLRFMKYRTPHSGETDLGGDIHTDKSILTILHQNEVSGLQVRTKEGEWIGFEPSPTSFVVLAGDALLAWSNGRVHSAVHRVVMKSGSKRPRYSLALFSFHSGMVRIPPELADDEHPLQYRDFDNYGLLRYFAEQSQLQQREASTAKAYCGI